MTWTPGPNDRITYDTVPATGEPADTLDEVVLTGVTVHLERMDDRTYALMIHADGNDLHVSLTAKRFPWMRGHKRTRCLAYVYERDGFAGVTE